MIEPYQWLITHADAYGYKAEHVGPASVDLCLGNAKRYSTRYQDFMPCTFDSNATTFLPEAFYLCSTQETISVPPTHCAFLNMRSSWARKGLGHKMAGFIDPGFTGQITLELETSIPVVVPLGERLVQLVYMRLTEPTLLPYAGRYQGQTGPTQAYA